MTYENAKIQRLSVQPPRADFGPFVGPAFRALKPYGCSAVRGFQPRREHAGYDESAWSQPTIEVYGCELEHATRELAALGWVHRVVAR